MSDTHGMRRYILEVSGFDPQEVIAETAGKARYANWCAAREAGYFADRDGFREYLRRTSTLHLGKSTEPTP